MKRTLFFILAALVALPILAASAAIPETKAVNSGAAYIASLQTPDGGYGGLSIGQNEDAILAVRAAGFDPAKDIAPGGKTPVDYLVANAASAVKPAEAGKAALAAKALGLDPKSVGGTNLIANINAGLDASSGKFAADDFSQAIAMIGLACTGNSVPASASSALKATQITPEGGWGFAGASDPDTTALAIQALLAAGVPKTDASITKAIGYIKTSQLPDGGWGFPPDSNANSTAYVVQALIAAGESLDIPVYIKAGASPVSFLLSQQNADGSFVGFNIPLATEQALPALAGRTLCNEAETAITQVRPQSTPTPSATASATPVGTSTPSASATARPSLTAAPGAPATGSGSSASSQPMWAVFGALFVLISGGAGAMAIRGRR
jgi:hypothetical protein